MTNGEKYANLFELEGGRGVDYSQINKLPEKNLAIWEKVGRSDLIKRKLKLLDRSLQTPEQIDQPVMSMEFS